MNITSITVRRLKTTNGFNNVAHEMTVAIDLAAGDDVEEARMQADLQVQAWNEQKTIDELGRDADGLKYEVDNLRRERDRLTIELEDVRRKVQSMSKTPLEQLMAEDDGRPF